MAIDRRISPTTGDFKPAANGTFETCDPLENKVAFSFLVERGSWEGDPLLGHRFRELERGKDLPGIELRIADLCLDAIQWLIDEGEIDHVVILAAHYDAGAVAFEVDIFPPGKPSLRRSYFVPVGAG